MIDRTKQLIERCADVVRSAAAADLAGQGVGPAENIDVGEDVDLAPGSFAAGDWPAQANVLQRNGRNLREQRVERGNGAISRLARGICVAHDVHGSDQLRSDWFAVRVRPPGKCPAVQLSERTQGNDQVRQTRRATAIQSCSNRVLATVIAECRARCPSLWAAGSSLKESLPEGTMVNGMKARQGF